MKMNSLLPKKIKLLTIIFFLIQIFSYNSYSVQPDEIIKNPLDPKSDIKEKSYAEKKGIKDNAYQFRSGKIQKKNYNQQQ